MEEVTEARIQEMAYVHGRNIYKYARKSDARRVTGKEPIRVRWVDTRKSDGIRARLVAMEFRRKHENAIFAATPPLESLRLLTHGAAQSLGDSEPKCIMNLDVRRAHFYAPARRRLFVQLPAEDPKSRDPEACGELLYSLYGTRDAASNWEQEYSDFLVSHGYSKGTASPCHFRKE